MTTLRTDTATKDAWAWTPPLPLKGIPVLVWPPRAGAARHWFGADHGGTPDATARMRARQRTKA